MSSWHGGKGSKPRKSAISKDQFDKQWELIFGKTETHDENRSEEGLEETRQSNEGGQTGQDNQESY